MHIDELPRRAARARPASAALLLGATMLAAPSLGQAQTAAVARPQDDAAIRAYWTPDRLAHAIPMERHPAVVRADGLPAGAHPLSANAPRRAGVFMPGNPGPDFVPDVAPRLYTPLRGTASPSSVRPPSSSGSDYYTTTRVFPYSTEPKVYPYRAAGHLFFTIQQSGGIDPPGNYECTASVIRQRIVVTAGHCVGSPSSSGFFFYENWMFIPADINGTAPYGTWTWGVVYVSGGWENGTGAVPNPEDWGMFVMQDNNGKTIGATVGWLGWHTNLLANNNITQLGYPGNLDNSAYMEQNQSQIEGSGGSNTYIDGSAEGPGSSGGPWIAGFGDGPKCTGTGCPTGTSGLGINTVVGVTSYGPTGTIGYEGASEFNSDFVTLYNSACGQASGNC
jgi:V8-like Glu-specific endopeptidase